MIEIFIIIVCFLLVIFVFVFRYDLFVDESQFGTRGEKVYGPCVSGIREYRIPCIPRKYGCFEDGQQTYQDILGFEECTSIQVLSEPAIGPCRYPDQRCFEPLEVSKEKYLPSGSTALQERRCFTSSVPRCGIWKFPTTTQDLVPNFAFSTGIQGYWLREAIYYVSNECVGSTVCRPVTGCLPKFPESAIFGKFPKALVSVETGYPTQEFYRPLLCSDFTVGISRYGYSTAVYGDIRDLVQNRYGTLRSLSGSYSCRYGSLPLDFSPVTFSIEESSLFAFSPSSVPGKYRIVSSNGSEFGFIGRGTDVLRILDPKNQQYYRDSLSSLEVNSNERLQIETQLRNWSDIRSSVNSEGIYWIPARLDIDYSQNAFAMKFDDAPTFEVIFLNSEDGLTAQFPNGEFGDEKLRFDSKEIIFTAE